MVGVLFELGCLSESKFDLGLFILLMGSKDQDIDLEKKHLESTSIKKKSH